jgi:hypothetical protein
MARRIAMAGFALLWDQALQLISGVLRTRWGQVGIVETNAVLALRMALLLTVNVHHVGHDLPLGVEHRAAIAPLPVSEAHVLPDAHLTIHSHNPLLPSTENLRESRISLEKH